MNRFFFASLLVGSACTAPCLAQDPRPEGQNPRRPNADRPEGRRPGEGRPGEGRPGEGRPGEGRPGGGFGGGAANPEMAARGMAMMLRNMPLFKALDADEDGQLSASEVENASKSILKLDKNGDGVVSAEEMRPEPGQMPMFAGPNAPGAPGNAGGPSPEMMMRMFENRDKDKDGKLSGDEIPPQMKERLSNIDTNGDGAIDKAEIEQSMKRLEGMRPGNRRPEGRTEGGEGVRPRRPTSDT